VITFTLVQINNSNQILKKSSKISHFCLLSLSEPPSLKISDCAPGCGDGAPASYYDKSTVMKGLARILNDSRLKSVVMYDNVSIRKVAD